MESLIFTKIFSVLAVPFIFIAGLFSTPTNLNLGASIPQGAAVFETSLLSPITSSATSLTLTANSVRGGSALSGFNCFTLDEGRAEREDICGTVSGTSMTGITRGVDPLTSTTTNATLQFAHRRGAQVKITDFPLIGIMRHQLNGSDTIAQPLRYADGVAPVQGSDLTDLDYVTGLAFSGIITGANFPNSNTLVWYDGANLKSTTTTPLYLGAVVATSTATSSIAQALGIASTTPWSKLSLGSGSITVAENRLSTSTNMTVDWRLGNSQLIRTGIAATTVGFTGYIPGQQLKVIVCNPGTTAGAITWTGVEWVGGANPTQSTTASVCDVWSFLATTATSTTNGVKIFGGVSNGFQ